MRVLIIPEDPTLDQYVLKPVVERIFADLGRPARVEVLRDPHLSGVDQALDEGMVAGIVEDNRMIDLFLLMVDRDCDRMNNTARSGARRQEHAERIVVGLAWQEVEVWPLAIHRAEVLTPFREVRAHCDPKEAFWDPFVVHKGWLGEVGKGRKKAMRNLGSAWSGVLKGCPEIAELKEELKRWVEMRRG